MLNSWGELQTPCNRILPRMLTFPQIVKTIFRILWNPKVHFLVHIMHQINPIHPTILCLEDPFSLSPHLFLGFPSCRFLSFVPHACSFNYFWLFTYYYVWTVQIMVLLFVQHYAFPVTSSFLGSNTFLSVTALMFACCQWTVWCWTILSTILTD